MSVPIYIAVALFALGVLLGLIFGPDSEREHAAHVTGWLAGYAHRRREEQRRVTPGDHP